MFLLKFQRPLGLVNLAVDRLLASLAWDVKVAGKLHRQRRPALQGLARRGVAHCCASDAYVVDAAMVVEPAVLDGDSSFAQCFGNF